MSFSWKRLLQIGKFIFPFVVLTIVFFQARKELAGDFISRRNRNN
ncbi:hypothetical protein ACUC2M_18625 [Bacillus cytotoxicus]